MQDFQSFKTAHNKLHLQSLLRPEQGWYAASRLSNSPWDDDVNRALNLFHIKTGNALELQIVLQRKATKSKQMKSMFRLVNSLLLYLDQEP